MVGRLTVVDAGLPAGCRGLFTTRQGGPAAGTPVRVGTDLSFPDDDRQRQQTQTTRDLLAAQAGVRELTTARQVHGAGVAVVGPAIAPARRTGGRDGVPQADALVTGTPGLGLLMLAADCMPVLFADIDAGVVAAAHAGRPGLFAGVLQGTVAAMVEMGATPAAITAVVGPCIGGCCYELPQEVVAGLDRQLPGVAATTRWGTPSIDLRTGAASALAAVGVLDVRHVGGCTFEQPALFYSYRRDGTAERHGGLVALA